MAAITICSDFGDQKNKRRLLLGRKVMTNLDSIFKSRAITLPTKVHLVKAVVFPVVMYGCESWTEPGGLLSMGSHRVGHDWSDLAAAAAAVLSFGLLCDTWVEIVSSIGMHVDMCSFPRDTQLKSSPCPLTRQETGSSRALLITQLQCGRLILEGILDF